MVLLFSSSRPSSCSSSSVSTSTLLTTHLRPDTAGASVRSPSSDALFAAPVVPSFSDLSQYPYYSLPIQFRLDELGTEMESEDDDCSESSSVTSDGASSFDSSSVCSVANELDSLNERRREMLQLSITKIQTMNSSNVDVSLRKSLLIYNTMKSLQRELEESGDDIYASLIEGNGGGLSSDDDATMNEEEIVIQREQQEEDWDNECVTFLQQEQCALSSYCRDRDSCHWWSWNYDNDNNVPLGSRYGSIQDLDICGEIMNNSSIRTNDTNNSINKVSGISLRNTSLTTGSQGGQQFWSDNITTSKTAKSTTTPTTNNAGTTPSAYIDDYFGMWGACEDDDYNPLNNCNLTQSEILHMFGLPTQHIVNNQLVSQA